MTISWCVSRVFLQREEHDMTNPIEATTHNGKTYYTTTVRGVEYCANVLAGQWVVTSSRLRGSHTVKFFPTVEALSGSVKAFANLDLFLNCEAVA